MENLISLANSLQFHKFTQELLNEECQYDPSTYTEKLMRNKRFKNLTYDSMVSQYSCNVKEVFIMQSYFQLQNMLMIIEQVILITLFCETLVIIYSDEDAKIGAFLCEMSLFVAIIMTDVASVMGPVMTGLTYVMIISFIIKVVIMAAHLPATIRHYRLVRRCKQVCKQNKWPTMAEDICLICQAYCRQVKQRVK